MEIKLSKTMILKKDLLTQPKQVKEAFTLSEILTTLAILGVVAAIMIPSSVKRTHESINKTKIKKSMEIYYNIISTASVENRLTSVAALRRFAGNNCSTFSARFDKKRGNNCRFSTSDGVWWDITNIDFPIIAFDQRDLNEETAIGKSPKAFHFMTSYDSRGIYRVNDIDYESRSEGRYDSDVFGYTQAKKGYSAKKLANILKPKPHSDIGTLDDYIMGKCDFHSGYSLDNASDEVTCVCLARDTQITLADDTTKAIQDIDFGDELKIWDFDNGRLFSAKPLWIKIAEVTNKYNLLTFSDGRTLKTIGQHRIFNKEAGKYTYPMTDATPIGTTTLLDDGSEVTLIKKEVVEEPVEFYNIMTEYHFNCFANGISTSNRFNNLYPIKDYKFVKDNRPLVPYDEYKQIPYEWYEKMRLAEQPKDLNRDGADFHAGTISDHILNVYIAKNKHKLAAV